MGKDMEHEDAKTIRIIIDAFQRADWDTVRRYWDDNIVVHYSGHGPLSGDHRGKDAVISMLQRLDELTENTFRMEIHDVLASEDHVVVLYNESAQRGGVEFSWNLVAVYHLRDGKIAEAWLHPGEQAELDEFLSR